MTTHNFLRTSRHAYGYQNTARRSRTLLKRRCCAIPISSFVVRRTRVAVSLYAALSRKAEIMIDELTGHAAENVAAPGMAKSSLIIVKWLYGFVGLTSQCIERYSQEGVEILHAVQYDPQQPIDFTFA